MSRRRDRARSLAPSLTVTCERSPGVAGTWLLDDRGVRDDGPGIPADATELVFDRFTTFDGQGARVSGARPAPDSA